METLELILLVSLCICNGYVVYMDIKTNKAIDEILKELDKTENNI